MTRFAFAAKCGERSAADSDEAEPACPNAVKAAEPNIEFFRKSRRNIDVASCAKEAMLVYLFEIVSSRLSIVLATIVHAAISLTSAAGSRARDPT